MNVRVFYKVEEAMGLFSDVGDEFSVRTNGAGNVGTSVKIDDDFAMKRDGRANGVDDYARGRERGRGGREKRDDERFFDLCRRTLRL